MLHAWCLGQLNFHESPKSSEKYKGKYTFQTYFDWFFGGVFCRRKFLLIFDTFMWNVNWQTSMQKCSVGHFFISRVTLMRFGQKAYYSVGTLEEYFIYLSFTGITPSVKFSQLCKWGSLTLSQEDYFIRSNELSSLVFYSKWKLYVNGMIVGSYGNNFY